MKKNVKPITPRCGICHRLYAVNDNNGTGLCLKCRTKDILPDINSKPEHIKVRGEQSMKEFDEMEKQKEVNLNESVDMQRESTTSIQESNQVQVVPNQTVIRKPENHSSELRIEDVVTPGRYGVSNSQMIPALKTAIAEQSIEKLTMLKATYFYTFEKSIKYLKKAERNYIPL